MNILPTKDGSYFLPLLLQFRVKPKLKGIAKLRTCARWELEHGSRSLVMPHSPSDLLWTER